MAGWSIWARQELWVRQPFNDRMLGIRDMMLGIRDTMLGIRALCKNGTDMSMFLYLMPVCWSLQVIPQRTTHLLPQHLRNKRTQKPANQKAFKIDLTDSHDPQCASSPAPIRLEQTDDVTNPTNQQHFPPIKTQDGGKTDARKVGSHPSLQHDIALKNIYLFLYFTPHTRIFT